MSVAAPPEPGKESLRHTHEEDFWERHSPHFEFSLANLASIVIHIIVFGLFLYYISLASTSIRERRRPCT